MEGYKIKKGWNINIDARSIHLDPNVYNEPQKFNPLRFDEEAKANSFLAFGMGGRTCLNWTCYGQSHDVSLSPPFYNHLQMGGGRWRAKLYREVDIVCNIEEWISDSCVT